MSLQSVLNVMQEKHCVMQNNGKEFLLLSCPWGLHTKNKHKSAANIV